MKRVKELDALRGVAALAVVLYHYVTIYNRDFGGKAHFGLGNFGAFGWGYLGVNLFFMISGFVIFLSLQNIKSVKDFALKRFLRLYPAYWICLTITTIALLLTSFSQPSFLMYLINITMFQKLFGVGDIDWSYWTLYIELTFYIMMAFVYKFKALHNINYICLVWLFLCYMPVHYPSIIHYSSLLNNVFNLKFGYFFIMGIMFYRLKYEEKGWFEHLIILLCLMVICMRNGYQYLACSAVFVLVFYLIIYDKLSFISKSRVLMFLGNISYVLYLIHQMIGYIIIGKLIEYGLNPNLVIVITVLFMILFSHLIITYLEKPFYNILKKFTHTYLA